MVTKPQMIPASILSHACPVNMSITSRGPFHPLVTVRHMQTCKECHHKVSKTPTHHAWSTRGFKHIFAGYFMLPHSCLSSINTKQCQTLSTYHPRSGSRSTSTCFVIEPSQSKVVPFNMTMLRDYIATNQEASIATNLFLTSRKIKEEAERIYYTRVTFTDGTIDYKEFSTSNFTRFLKTYLATIDPLSKVTLKPLVKVLCLAATDPETVVQWLQLVNVERISYEYFWRQPNEYGAAL